jgi:hypothetical protein
MNYFTHKPRGYLDSVIHPIRTKKFWDAVWQAARAQPWWHDDLGYVGSKDGYHYFQAKGVTTGFARLADSQVQQ